MTACGNCGQDNLDGNDICARCAEMYREEDDRREQAQRDAEREDRQRQA